MTKAPADGLTAEEERARFAPKEFEPPEAPLRGDSLPVGEQLRLSVPGQAAATEQVSSTGPEDVLPSHHESAAPEANTPHEVEAESEEAGEEEETVLDVPAESGTRARKAPDAPDGSALVEKDVSGTTTPAPVYQFSTASGLKGGHPADAQLSVGFSHVCVTARSDVGCYTKGGKTVKIHSSSSSDVKGVDFFSRVIQPGETVFDMRTMYDHHRNRFWVVALTTCSDGAVCESTKRRLVIAVSKSENPELGWHQYAFNATPSGAPNSNLTQKVDYPSIGIDEDVFVATHKVVSKRDCDSDSELEWCEDYWLVHLRDADAMANGESSIGGWNYWDLQHSGGARAIPVPVIHDESSSHSRVYLLAQKGSKISVFAVSNPLASSRSVSRIDVNVDAFGSVSGLTQAQKPNPSDVDPHGTPPKIKFDNIGNRPIHAHYRSGWIVMTANDSWTIDGVRRAAGRLIQLDVSTFGSGTVGLDIDRTFGRRSAGDASSAVFDYGWAAAALNRNGDIGMMSMRTDDSIHPELRMQVWASGDTDLRSTILAHASPYALYPSEGCCDGLTWVDTASSSVDPYDDVGMYFAQEYGATVGYNNYRIRVVKELGVKRSDIVPYSASSSKTTIARGSSVTLTSQARNLGDKDTPTSKARWYLSTNDLISTNDTPLGSVFTLDSFNDKSSTSTLSATIPSSTATGKYYIGVCYDIESNATEYREGNNCFESDGNVTVAPIAVTIN